MYDELVKDLRESAPKALAEADFDFVEGWLKEAADAIEELQKAVNFHKFNSEFWEDKYNSLADEKWIPVTERLPEVRTWEDDGLRCSSNVLFRTDRTIHIGYVIEDFYVDEYAGKVKLHRWYMQGGYRIEDVTHWMPLPQPPKEEQA